MNHLDKVVEEKNQHITELKQVIQRLENGRVMRALNRVQKLRGRS
jgi:exonuclease VII small subunit